MTDILTGKYAATAVLAALADRERSGEGQRVDLALLDVQMATLANLVETITIQVVEGFMEEHKARRPRPAAVGGEENLGCARGIEPPRAPADLL